MDFSRKLIYSRSVIKGKISFLKTKLDFYILVVAKEVKQYLTKLIIK